MATLALYGGYGSASCDGLLYLKFDTASLRFLSEKLKITRLKKVAHYAFSCNRCILNPGLIPKAARSFAALPSSSVLTS